MRHETRPDGAVREIGEATHCDGCGQRFLRRLSTFSWTNCHCITEGTGHRVTICLRPGCSAKTFDPPHAGQWGPSADYGRQDSE